MKAHEARELAKAANTGNLDEVYKAIETFARKGDVRTHIYYLLTPDQKQILESEGYKVTDISERNETVIEISWE